MRKFFVPAALFAAILSGCVGRQAFYVSPYNGISQRYGAIPLRSDSARSATYLGGSLAFGDANDRGKDSKFALHTNLHRASNFGSFQARYGLSVSAGNYRLQSFDSVDVNSSVDIGYLNRRAGNYFFGGASAEGAVNLAVPLRKGEWRVLGAEASLTREFGAYSHLRNRMPDTVATQVVRSPWYGAAGITSEFVFGEPGRNGGFRMAYGWTIGKNYREYAGIDQTLFPRTLAYHYFTLAGQLTHDQKTFFLQFNFAEKAHAFQFGVNLRLGRRP